MKSSAKDAPGRSLFFPKARFPARRAIEPCQRRWMGFLFLTTSGGWRQDCSGNNAPGLWLRDGDGIEVPEK